MISGTTPEFLPHRTRSKAPYSECGCDKPEALSGCGIDTARIKAVRVSTEWEKAGVYYVRTEAMVFGFGVPLQGEFSGDDENSKYILVLDDTGKPLSTNRIRLMPEKNLAKIERVATVSNARGKGAGRTGIEEAEKWILEMGYRKIVITSRKEAVGFYEKLGYKVYNDINPDTLEKWKPGESKDVRDPRFICVYMEKYMDPEAGRT